MSTKTNTAALVADTNEATLRAQSVADLVAQFKAETVAEDKFTANLGELATLMERITTDRSNTRVKLARITYLLATHKDLRGRKTVNATAAGKALNPELSDDKARQLVRWHVKAGQDLADAGLVFNTGEPTEEERAIVEQSHDVNARAKAAKANEARKAKADKGAKAEESDDVPESPAEDGVSPKDMLAKLATVETMLNGFTAAGGKLTDGQAELLTDALMALAAKVEEAK